MLARGWGAEQRQGPFSVHGRPAPTCLAPRSVYTASFIGLLPYLPTYHLPPSRTHGRFGAGRQKKDEVSDSSPFQMASLQGTCERGI